MSVDRRIPRDLPDVVQVDLLLSVQHGYWCTRRHNETTMNHAYNSVDHVYLIFGVNKSGEFFGYGKWGAFPRIPFYSH